MKCAGCFKNIRAATSIGCNFSTCKRRFCYGCIDANFVSPNKVKQWLCLECSEQERKERENSSTPLIKITDPVYDDLDIHDISNVKSYFIHEITSLKYKLGVAVTSLERCHERIDFMSAAIATNESRISVLESRNSEIDNLKCKISELQTEISVQSQKNLKNEIEICGVPECPNENVTHIVLLLSHKIGVELTDRDIDWAGRTGPRLVQATNPTRSVKRNSRPIVVRLQRRMKRDEIFKGFKIRKHIMSTDLHMAGPAQKVYVNERLVPKDRLLFHECRSQAKQMNFNFCWCHNGTIYIRQREGKPAIAIRSNDDLARLVSKNKTTRNE